MKLIDPTDDALNAAFAEHVAGFSFPTAPSDGRCDEWRGANYRGSADVILPWLEKYRDRAAGSSMATICADYASQAPFWTVIVGPAIKDQGDLFRGDHESLAKAAVIALLRAHNIEIEFTK